MTTRDDIVRTALSFNGSLDGQGYNCQNVFSSDLGRPTEAWCGDFVTDIFKRAQVPLPSMQPGCRTGFAYCPDAVDYGHAHGADRNSWEAQPADIVLFDWDGDSVADHTELVTAYQNGTLFTIGGNSGPSNVDGFTHDGGVHRHQWAAPPGQGNDAVLAVIDTSKVVHFGGPPHPTKPAKPTPAEPRLLMLKSPMMTGADVLAVQHALNQRENAGLDTDSTYGPATRDAVIKWQGRTHIEVDGIVGPHTRSSLGLPS
jgi:hypothetical protein